MPGLGLEVSGLDASGFANVYSPPVEGAVDWVNTENSTKDASRRLKNWGTAGGSVALSGNAALAAVGVQAAAGTESRMTLGTHTDDAFTLIALVDVGLSAAIMRQRNIRLQTDATKKLKRVMTAGTSISTFTLPSTGAFVVFINGDLTGHSFGMLTATSVQKVDSAAVNSSTTATFVGGVNDASEANAWTNYGAAYYNRRLTDAEMMLVAQRLIKRARELGVTVNG